MTSIFNNLVVEDASAQQIENVAASMYNGYEILYRLYMQTIPMNIQSIIIISRTEYGKADASSYDEGYSNMDYSSYPTEEEQIRVSNRSRPKGSL